jgi:hypothetical protein
VGRLGRIPLRVHRHGQQRDRGLRRPRIRAGDGRRRSRDPGRRAAGLGPSPARRQGSDPGLRAGPHPDPVRARRRARRPGGILWGHAGGAGGHGSEPPPPLPGTPGGLHSQPTVPAADPGRGGEGGSEHQPIGSADPVRRPGRPQTGALDGRASGRCRGGHDRGRGGVRLPRWQEAAGAGDPQRLGLEWLFRLVNEPRRLWRRYLYRNPRFVALFATQLVRQRLAGIS